MITLPICRHQYSSFNDDKRGIFHTLINTSFASRSSCAFFVQGGLSPPEFCCAFFKAQKVPPWNKNSAPLTRKKRPTDRKKRPPEKADPPINFLLLTKRVTWDTVWGGIAIYATQFNSDNWVIWSMTVKKPDIFMVQNGLCRWPIHSTT